MFRNKWLLIVAGICCAGWIVVWAWGRLLPPPSYLELARRATRAVHARDAKAILSSMNPVERDVGRVTVAAMQVLLDKAVPSDFSSWSYLDEGYVTELSGSVNLRTVYQGPDGRRATLDLTVANTDEGPGAFLLVPILYMGIEASSDKKSESRQADLAQWLRKHSQTLEDVGLAGFVSSATGKLVGWSDAARFLEGASRRK